MTMQLTFNCSVACYLMLSNPFSLTYLNLTGTILLNISLIFWLCIKTDITAAARKACFMTPSSAQPPVTSRYQIHRLNNSMNSHHYSLVFLIHMLHFIYMLFEGCCATSDPVSTRMGDHLWAGKPCRYVTSQPGRLSLLPSVGQ